jgi:hypothetical protein
MRAPQCAGVAACLAVSLLAGMSGKAMASEVQLCVPTGGTPAQGACPGTTGKQGASGVTGAIGAAGAGDKNGEAGTTVTTGPTGPQGPIGVTGATGPPGAQGAAGANGAGGNSGATGNTGATGAQGVTGGVGPTGVTGTSGAIGTRGQNGAAGATGPSGPSGGQGQTGPAGPEGAPGSSVVARVRSVGPFTATSEPEDVPLSGGTWTQQAEEVDQLVGQVRMHGAGGCRVRFYVDGRLQARTLGEGNEPTETVYWLIGKGPGGSASIEGKSVLLGLALSGWLYAPEEATTHTLTAAADESCVGVPIESISISVIGVH